MVSLAVIKDMVAAFCQTTSPAFATTHTQIATNAAELALFAFYAQLNVVILKFVSYLHKHTMLT